MLTKIHNSPRSTKRLWFVGLSLVLVIIAIVMWMQFFSWQLAQLNPGVQATASSQPNANGLGAGDTAKSLGASILEILTPSRTYESQR